MNELWQYWYYPYHSLPPHLSSLKAGVDFACHFPVMMHLVTDLLYLLNNILSPGGEDFTQNWGLAHNVAQTVWAETAALFLILNLEEFLKSFNLSFLKTLPHGTSWTQQSPVGIQVGRDTKRTFQSSGPEHLGPLSSRKLPGGLCPPSWDFQSHALRTLRVEVLTP